MCIWPTYILPKSTDGHTSVHAQGRHGVPQAALQDIEAQLLQLQTETEAQTCQLETRTQEVQMLQELSAEQQAAMASNTKQSQESQQRLTQDAANLQVIFSMSDDVVLRDRLMLMFQLRLLLLLQHSMSYCCQLYVACDQQQSLHVGTTASKTTRVLCVWAALPPTSPRQSRRYTV